MIMFWWHGSKWELIKRIEKKSRPLAVNLGSRMVLSAILADYSTVDWSLKYHLKESDAVIKGLLSHNSLRGLTPESFHDYPLRDRVSDFAMGKDHSGNNLPINRRTAEISIAAEISTLIFCVVGMLL